MRQWIKPVVLLLFVTAALSSVAGCSRFSRPTDAEALKAIESSGALKGQGFTITSPLEIVERGGRDDNGSWHYKIRFTLTMRMMDGTISEPKQNTITFKIARSKDSAGNTLWTATL